MTSILVTFDAGERQPATVAAYVASVLSERGFDVRTLPVSKTTSVDLGAFDGVLISASGDDGTYSDDIVAFVAANRASLAATTSGVVQVSGASEAPGRAVIAADAASVEAVTAATAATGWEPDRVGVFAGAFTAAPYGTPRRWLFEAAAFVRGLGSDDRRREYPDWPDVERFAVAFGMAVERERKRAVAAERDRRPVPAWVGARELWMSLLALGVAVVVAIATRGRDRDRDRDRDHDREDAPAAIDVHTEDEERTADRDDEVEL